MGSCLMAATNCIIIVMTLKWVQKSTLKHIYLNLMYPLSVSIDYYGSTKICDHNKQSLKWFGNNEDKIYDLLFAYSYNNKYLYLYYIKKHIPNYSKAHNDYFSLKCFICKSTLFIKMYLSSKQSESIYLKNLINKIYFITDYIGEYVI